MPRRPANRSKRDEPRRRSDQPPAVASAPQDDEDDGTLIDLNSDISPLHCETDGGKAGGK